MDMYPSLHYLVCYELKCEHIYFVTEKSFKSSKLAKATSLSSFDWLLEKEEAFYLHSLGPNSASMGQLSKDFKLLPAQTSDG